MFRWEAIDCSCTNTMALYRVYYSPQTGISCNTQPVSLPVGPLSRDSHHQAFDAFDRYLPPLLPLLPSSKISLDAVLGEKLNSNAVTATRRSIHIPRIFSTIQILGKNSPPNGFPINCSPVEKIYTA